MGSLRKSCWKVDSRNYKTEKDILKTNFEFNNLSLYNILDYIY